MAALTLRTEAGGVRPEFEHEGVRRRRALLSDPAALSPRARQINERAWPSWRLSWSRAGLGQKTLLLKAWRDARGPVHPMNYTPALKTDSSALEVRFVPDTLRIRREGPQRYAMDVEIEAVR